MTGLMFGIIFGALGLLIVAIAIVGAKRQMDTTNAAWQRAAETLGLAFEPGSMRGGPTIDGTVDGHEANVHSYTKSSGKSSTRYTRYTVGFPAIGVGLQLSKQAGLGQFLKVLGAQDIVIGDPVFDDAFIVKATDPQAARSILTPGRTMALNRLLSVHPEVVVLDNEVVLDRRGSVRDADVIASTLRRLASVATTLGEVRPSEELTALAETRLEGDIPDYEPDDTVTIDTRLTAGEALMVSGLAEAAKKIFDSLAIELPADVEVKGWSTQAAQRPAPPSQPPVESAVPEPPPPPPTPESTEVSVVYAAESGVANADPIGVATYLFGENRLSFETAALFDESYAGKWVEWSGKVRTSSRVDSDRVLGDGPFLKAVVEVASLENDLYGNTVVSAIVAFPPEQALSPGREITFTGELVAIDALVRNLYVTNAHLT